MISVCLIITGLSTGGAEMMLFKLLQNLDRSRFRVAVISLTTKGDIGRRIEGLGVPVFSLNMSRGVPNPLSVLQLSRLLREIKPDLVHTWMYHADMLGGMIARLSGVNHVIWCIRHSNLSKKENKRSTLWVVKICAFLSHVLPVYILTCSSRAADVHAKIGYAEDKLHVIPNGFDLNHFVPNVSARASVRAELGLSTDVPLVGLVARFDSQKNHIGFIDAASLVHAELPHVHFVLAGTGVDSTNSLLSNAIAARGLQANVHMLGRRDDVPRLMASLDVLASPSHGEAFPNVLGEAMACGVPCVVTDVGDSAEIVGSTGRVVAPGDMAGLAEGLLELLRLSFEQKSTLGRQARDRVAANYEISHVARLYEDFYERATTTNGIGVA